MDFIVSGRRRVSSRCRRRRQALHAILIQATDAEIYEIDSFEIIDATGTTIKSRSHDDFLQRGIVPGPGTGSLLDSQASGTAKAP